MRTDHHTRRIPGPPELRERGFEERFPGVDVSPALALRNAWLVATWTQPSRTGCYVCRFHGAELSNGHIRCGLPDGRTMGYAARGCCYWQREPGADDE